MSKILYGLCGVGIGHAVRGKVIIEELRKNNEVMVICSSKPYEYLKQYFGNVHKIEGFELVFRNNSIADYLTLFKNLKKINKLNFESIYELLDKFNPDLVNPEKIYNFDLKSDDLKNQHAIRIHGAAELKPGKFEVKDLRHGATLIMAAMIAHGTSELTGIEQVDRGYEDLDGRLRSMGAMITRS